MGGLKVVCFRIGKEEYAVDIMKVDSIIKIEKVNWIPEIPSFIEGVIDFRGTVIPLVNGRKKFFMASSEKEDDKNRAIVVNYEDRKVALFVDEVTEVVTLGQDSLKEPPPEVSNESNDYVSAISNFKNRMIIVLDLEKMLNTKELVTFSNSEMP